MFNLYICSSTLQYVFFNNFKKWKRLSSLLCVFNVCYAIMLAWINAFFNLFSSFFPQYTFHYDWNMRGGGWFSRSKARYLIVIRNILSVSHRLISLMSRMQPWRWGGGQKRGKTQNLERSVYLRAQATGSKQGPDTQLAFLLLFFFLDLYNQKVFISFLKHEVDYEINYHHRCNAVWEILCLRSPSCSPEKSE